MRLPNQCVVVVVEATAAVREEEEALHLLVLGRETHFLAPAALAHSHSRRCPNTEEGRREITAAEGIQDQNAFPTVIKGLRRHQTHGARSSILRCCCVVVVGHVPLLFPTGCQVCSSQTMKIHYVHSYRLLGSRWHASYLDGKSWKADMRNATEKEGDLRKSSLKINRSWFLGLYSMSECGQLALWGLVRSCL